MDRMVTELEKFQIHCQLRLEYDCLLCLGIHNISRFTGFLQKFEDFQYSEKEIFGQINYFLGNFYYSMKAESLENMKR